MKAEELSRLDRKTLSNRFYVTRARAEDTGASFEWTSFSDWLEDFLKLAPSGIKIKDYRISYEMEDGNLAYNKDSMRLRRSATRTKRARSAPATTELKLHGSEDGTTIIEIARVIMECLREGEPVTREMLVNIMEGGGGDED